MENKLVSFLSKVLGEPNSQSKGEYLFWSPFINHRKKKLNVNLDPNRDEFGYWKCWVSEESGKSLFTLLKRSNNKSKMSQLSRLISNSKVRFSGRSNRPKKKEKEDECVTLPEEFKPLSEHSNSFYYKLAFKFLLDRGLSISDVVRYNIGYCSEGKYKGRVIVPSYSQSGSTNYFIARAFTNSWLKYMNPPASKNVIAFESFLDWNNPIVITEGVFDAIAIRRNAVPILGKKINSKLKNKLIEKCPPKVYLCLDDDALKDASEAAEYLSNQGLSVNIVNMPEGEDPADLGFEKVWKLIKESSPTNFRDLVKYKLFA